jgi:hypothetical protein
VLVLHLYQSAILNRAAVAALGYTKDTPNPPGGQIVRDYAGNPTGVQLAAPAPFILYGALGRLPLLDPDQQLSSTRHFFRELNRFGITSAIDAAGGSQQFPDNYAAVMHLADRGELSVRIAYHLLPQTAGRELQDLTRWVETMRIGDGNEWLRLNGAGEALTLSSVDFENFCEPRPELPGTVLDEVEQAVRILVGNDWASACTPAMARRSTASSASSISSPRRGCSRTAPGGFSTMPKPSAHGRSSGSAPSAVPCPSRTAPCSSPSRSSIGMGERWPKPRPLSAPCSTPD